MNDVVKSLPLSLADFNYPDCLIYGIGNVARQDDGLAWALIDWLEREGLCPDAEKVRNYQLFLEDADLISTKRRVLFIDATRDVAVVDYSLTALTEANAKLDFSFTSHAISIPSIMATCQLCFEVQPEVYVLAIRGYEWALEEGLTGPAKANLAQLKLALTR
ncbi:hydrogenase maturation protease [Amphritea sp.]|uniref:hydrogenase maturation protease n=1 Tax=Amphritea sp. TaxID=1872502 RepID=UPI003A8E0A6C